MTKGAHKATGGRLCRSLALACLVLALPAWGATYYVDCDNGNNGNDGSSTALAKLTVGNITIAGSDTVYIKGGTTCREQITLTSIDGVTIANWPSDTDDEAGAWIIDGENTRSYGILADRTSNTTISDGEIKNATQNAIAWVNDSAGVTDTNMTLNRVVAHDIGPGVYPMSGESQFDDGTCFFARTGPNTGTAVLNGLTYNDTAAYNCGKHGYDTRWRLLNVTHNRAVAYETGLTSTGHGFSAHPLFETFTSTGWTDADGGGAGTIYYRDRSSNANEERRIVETSAATILTQNTGTPTAPANGEWGRVVAGAGGACAGNATVGCLYVNVGGVLTGKTFIVKRFAHGPFVYNQCRAYNIRDTFALSEGHGFSMDDLSGPGVYNGSYAYDNEGHGFTTLRGESVQWLGSIARNNALSSFHFNNCTNCEASNTVGAGSGTRAYWDGGFTSVNVDLTNNVAINDAVRGFNMSAGTAAASGFSSAANYSHNNDTNTCANVTCTEADPQFIGGANPTTPWQFAPGARSPLAKAGRANNTADDADQGDFYGDPMQRPSMGAWQ